MKRIALFHLETLHWISRLGTFRAAAERLNTTQPAISARVREIEEQLGMELFRRQGRKMVLTARGRLLVQACEPLRHDLERTLLEIGDYAGAAGVVRIASGEIAAASCLPAFIQAIERDLPGVTMEVELDLTARMLQQVLAGTTDLAFLAGPVAGPGLKTAPLGSVSLVWVAGPRIAQAGGFSKQLPVWSLPIHSPLHAVTVESIAANGVSVSSLNTCNNVRTIVRIVSDGGGAAVLPESMIRAELAEGSLLEILPRPERRIHFEAAIRVQEQEPLLLELFRRAADLRIDPGMPAAEAFVTVRCLR
ncbi:MAG TPA: LysR family transcriptional regulator [Novosphingobium sp.]|nr:LysR family transcriptional regulator [Candidatus Polarisedimenticolia bacterium]HKX79261.1 LysR family transcriptional regulator [Novosphingobium sp.]